MVVLIFEKSVTGVAKAHFQIFQTAEATIVVVPTEALVQRWVEKDVNASKQTRAGLEILATGRERDHYRHCRSRSARTAREKVTGQELMMVHVAMDSGIEERHQQLGERVAHRMEHHAANFKNAQLSRELLLPLSKIASGAQRCALMLLQPRRLHHPEMAVRLQALQLPRLLSLVDQNST